MGCAAGAYRDAGGGAETLPFYRNVKQEGVVVDGFE